jgi:hypothetical protein
MMPKASVVMASPTKSSVKFRSAMKPAIIAAPAKPRLTAQ